MNLIKRLETRHRHASSHEVGSSSLLSKQLIYRMENFVKDIKLCNIDGELLICVITHTDSNERFSLQHSLAEIISLIFQRKKYSASGMLSFDMT